MNGTSILIINYVLSARVVQLVKIQTVGEADIDLRHSTLDAHHQVVGNIQDVGTMMGPRSFHFRPADIPRYRCTRHSFTYFTQKLASFRCASKPSSKITNLYYFEVAIN